MPMGKGLQRLFNHRKRLHITTTQTIALIFALIILVGAGLLMLPFSSRGGVSCGPLTALFTSTSATCVTGLVVRDTWTQWSGFGQAVILCLIELGGLGFISVTSLVIFMLRKKVGLKQRMTIAQAYSLDDMQGVVRLQKRVLGGSLTIQAVGALLLTIRFIPEYGLRRGVIWGVFHSVSAFCNAGFDILGGIAPGASIAPFREDPVVMITLMLLIVLGGLGFFVWEEIATKRSLRKCSVYSKLVLLVTGILVFGGAGLFLLLEWNNPATIGEMNVGTKILNAFFQSVTLRTAGFASFDQAGLTEAGKGLSILLMYVGGSSGSTAGGIKTVTVLLLFLFLAARLRGRRTVTVMHRSIPEQKVLDAMTLASLVVLFTLFGAIFISVSSGVGFLDAFFESTSAIATVGLSTGITPVLSAASKILIIVFMYFGRVGILTISLGFLMADQAQSRFRYAYTNLLVG